MGEIYLASLRREGGFEKAVAVKRILPHLADDPSFVQMFEAEARLTALLNHPNIVHIYDFGKVDGQAYIAMEMVDGFDLRALLDLGREAGHPLPPELGLVIAADCAGALEYAHRRRGPDGQPLRLIHRDISPQNILISLEGQTKLTDFGLAKALSLDTGSLSGMLKGKLAYMAPEQIRGEPLDARTDVFALGAVLYEMLSGGRLYPPNLPVAQLVARVTRAEFTPLDATALGLPAPVVAVATRCLAADPADRFETAAELEAALRGVGVDAGLVSAPGALAEYVVRFADHRKVVPGHAEDGTVVSKRPIVRREGIAPEPPSVAEQAHTRVEGGGRLRSLPVASEVLDASDHDRAAGVVGAAVPDDAAEASEPHEVSGPVTAPEETGALELAVPRRGRGVLTLGALLLVSFAVLAIALWPTPRTEPPPDRSPPEEVTDPPLIQRPAPSPEVASRRPRRGLQLAALPPPRDAVKLQVVVSAEGARCFVMNLLTTSQHSEACGTVITTTAGPHRLVVTAPGHVTATLTEVVERAGDSADDFVVVVEVTLEAAPPEPCTVALSSEPTGAAVTLDGAVQGQTPLTLEALAPGEHGLEVARPGYGTHTQPLVCDADTPAELLVRLARRRIALSIAGRRSVVESGGDLGYETTMKGVLVKVRLVANAGGARVLVDARPYVQVRLGTGAARPTPATLQLRGARSRRLSISRDGARIGTIRVRAAPVTDP